VLLHRSVGLADRTQAEVVGPSMNLPVERFYQRCRSRRTVTAWLRQLFAARKD
jgi:hypothetical protein